MDESLCAREKENGVSLLMVQEQEKRAYYDLFQDYIENYCYDDENSCYLIRFLPTKKREGYWYIYKDGVYKLTTQPEIDIYYFNAMNIYNQKTSTSALNFCMTKLKIWSIMKWDDWDDHNPEWENKIVKFDSVLFHKKVLPVI